MSASTTRMTIGRRIYLVKRNGSPATSDSAAAPVRLNHLSEVAAQPLHRALGLTDWEGRTIFGTCSGATRTTSSWRSSPCSGRSTVATSTRRRSSRRLPSSGDRVLQGPGENAGVIDLGEGEGRRVQGRVPQPSVRRRAVPGRGNRRRRNSAGHRSRWARGRLPCSTACCFGAPDFHFDPCRRRHRPLRKLRRCPDRRRRRRISTRPTTNNCLVNAMCVGHPGRPSAWHSSEGEAVPGQSRRPLRRDDGARRDRRRVGAGVTGAGVRTTQTSGRPSRSEIPSPARS